MQVAFKFWLLLLLVPPLLCHNQQIDKAFLKGTTFQGQVTLSKDSLKIDIVEFSRGQIYSEEISNLHIERQCRRFLVFKNAQELFQEFKDNDKMYIIEDKLIVPIEVTYKMRKVELKLEIPLTPKWFATEAERFQTLLSIIEALNKEKARMQRELIPQKIDFKPDHTNKNIGMFEVSKDGKRIKSLSKPNYVHYIFNDAQVLPKRGVFYFDAKIIQSPYKFIFFGICGKSLKDSQHAIFNPLFMGYHIQDGRMYADTQNIIVTAAPKIVMGQTVIRLEIDMNRKWFSIYLNKGLLYATEIRKQLTETDIYPLITLATAGDILEIV